ncbi:hypothetical protein EDWATA_02177 [Edwardsiella tarda ATCC 23685]|uniref:DUF1367 family protein n=1 Tax=Edwardsiella tarda ATCC 23685 TaxID=500638 RepID=D4F5Z7_EDWTA|nr:DUF1367 family protein [Edwardsiella tarda]EFE22805.1 hypothetical protein EDWATA_02177 [Edwardsiella tarda ATCC 23685]GAC63842.1 hypothetical protein ET1_07_00720 [Edwardsiella tarda ATCC 15947 = NBRC 105688]STD44856.1 Protein of uncharacterised function (DUF1367) [Edwardsiella tarda]
MSSAQGKSPRRHKAEALGVLLPGGGICYATDHDRDVMRAVPVGTPIALQPVGDRRNLKHHRKFFKLLELGMQYWIPRWDFVSRSENWVAHTVARRIAEAAADPSLYDNVTRQIAQGVLACLAEKRRGLFDAEAIKTDEAYLNHVMTQAGFCDVKPAPDGGTFRQRWSIAFANMDQATFDRIYRGVAGVIWNETLSQHFASEAEMELALNQLMAF